MKFLLQVIMDSACTGCNFTGDINVLDVSAGVLCSFYGCLN